VDTRQLIATVSAPINRIGSAWYFLPETVAVGRSIGLDGFRFYFLGRGGVLGDVEWPIVLSAFGYFNPALVDKMWTTAKQRSSVAAAAAAHIGCCQEFGRTRLGQIKGLEAFCEAAEAVNAAALVDAAAFPLYAGYSALSLAADPPGRAMQLAATLREFRGSAHLVAVVASGLPTPVAHRIRRPDDVERFGWGPGAVRAPTEDDRRRLATADELTDRLVEPSFAKLDDDGAAALVAGVDAIAHALGGRTA
jgi:hypothetical protein